MKLVGKRIGKGIIGHSLLFGAFIVSVAFPNLVISSSPVERIGPILFVTYQDGNNEIYAMNADGGNLRKLTNLGAQGPKWSPNGKKILFYAGGQIYTMDPDGSNVTNISGPDNPNNCCADWSPNGKKIAFVSFREGNDEIYVMDADGSNKVRLTKDPAQDMFPVWSPNGKKIAFISKRDHGWPEIYTMNPDGAGLFAVTLPPATAVEGLSWSPNGKMIAFASGDPGFRGINIINKDGTGRVVVTNPTGGGGIPDRWPAWSPNGEKIVYGSNVADEGYRFELFAISVDGSSKRQLTFSSSGVWNHLPDWGRHAFIQTPEGGVLNSF